MGQKRHKHYSFVYFSFPFYYLISLDVPQEYKLAIFYQMNIQSNQLYCAISLKKLSRYETQWVMLTVSMYLCMPTCRSDGLVVFTRWWLFPCSGRFQLPQGLWGVCAVDTGDHKRTGDYLLWHGNKTTVKNEEQFVAIFEWADYFIPHPNQRFFYMEIHCCYFNYAKQFC